MESIQPAVTSMGPGELSISPIMGEGQPCGTLGTYSFISEAWHNPLQVSSPGLTSSTQVAQRYCYNG